MMSDLINRQDAINALTEANLKRHMDSVEGGQENRSAIRIILELPSAERNGKWQEVYAETDYRNGWIEFSCECCEYQHGLESGEYDWHYGDEIPWKFCPICGARMDERREDERLNKQTGCD